ncbi:hypothetical protein DPMN_182971 [Dreissena polymorpha]|uniref:Secreted protein n=1 Tax=Dreissena polymorpha TaxID=45954 RepID=A0A9D4I538_DREPO|nr:hypothetical protein DPMN_182971 [Dreissena polymorpha]
MCTTVFKQCLLKVLILVSLMTTSASAREPDCSRFHYKDKLLEKIIRMEIHLETVDKHLISVWTRIYDGKNKYKN